MRRDELKNEWNIHADGWNRWDKTSAEERIDFMYEVLNAVVLMKKSKKCHHNTINTRLEMRRFKYNRRWIQTCVSVEQCAECGCIICDA